MRAATLGKLQDEMLMRERRKRHGRKVTAALRWRRAARKREREAQREEELLTISNQRELTLDELLELAGPDLRPMSEQDWEAARLKPGELESVR